MRTRDTAEEITQLPPPPAPTARDANPWPLSSVQQPARRTPSIRRPRARKATMHPAREGMRNLLFLGIVAFIVVSGVVEVLQGGGPEALAGIAIPLFILAILFLARRRKSRRGGDGVVGMRRDDS